MWFGKTAFQFALGSREDAYTFLLDVGDLQVNCNPVRKRREIRRGK